MRWDDCSADPPRPFRDELSAIAARAPTASRTNLKMPKDAYKGTWTVWKDNLSSLCELGDDHKAAIEKTVRLAAAALSASSIASGG